MLQHIDNFPVDFDHMTVSLDGDLLTKDYLGSPCMVYPHVAK